MATIANKGTARFVILHIWQFFLDLKFSKNLGTRLAIVNDCSFIMGDQTLAIRLVLNFSYSFKVDVLRGLNLCWLKFTDRQTLANKTTWPWSASPSGRKADTSPNKQRDKVSSSGMNLSIGM